jgi:hypothetical protein
MTAFVTDEEVLTRLSTGDRDACLMLFHRYYSRIEAYARLHLDSAGEVAQTTCATFQSVCHAPLSLNAPNELSCLGLLLQRCRSLIYPTSAPFAAPMLPPRDNGNPPHMPELSVSPVAFERLAADPDGLQAALARLSPADRDIIHLTFVPGLTHAEIALLTGHSSTDAVALHLYRAMQRLAFQVERGNGVRR